MRKFIKPALIFAGIIPAIASAQDVDRTKYPDYSSVINPDYSLLQGSVVSSRHALNVEDPLPDHVNNAETKYFPPVFNQDGGSCGSASRICYMFTHEINAYRNADAKLLSNRYPSHFVWLLTNGNSGKDEFVQFVGVPNAEVYGGTTYSALFGNQDTSQDHFGWMQGYDKWYSGMWNRMYRPAHVPMTVETEEGRKILKRWLYNHNGDNSFHAGGIAGIGVASGGQWEQIPNTPTNKEIGVSGKFFVKRWGWRVDHALTIVGYDDRIEFDLDGNGKVGEKDKDEVGAWIVVNSWSDGWCNKGFIYCPYKFAGPSFKRITENKEDPSKDVYDTMPTGYWQPEIYHLRKDYRPLRTIKLLMDYSRRSELKLSVGVSSDLNASVPEKTIPMHHFQYAGDGANGDTNPAPEIPMLGRWADGKLHDEPMEFGYDLTDLSDGLDKNSPLKYFFIIETKSSAIGEGKIHNASIINYESDKLGVETPFVLQDGAVQIQNKGKKTIISTIVYGEGYYAPNNFMLEGNRLTWDAPLRSGHKVIGYKIYCNGATLAEMGAELNSYDIADMPAQATFSLSAIYEDKTESSKVNASTPVVNSEVNHAITLNHSGFRIPNVFSNKFNEATIEFWIKPYSIINWNQQVGPGWGNFLFHANSNGAISVGWDTTDRIVTEGNKLGKNRWSHIAIVVMENTMKLYVNGISIATCSSSRYNGIGGFGDLVFNAEGENDMHAQIEELRIWNIAKSSSEIKYCKNAQFEGKTMPYGLIAYFKGELFNDGNKTFIRDYIGGNHAEILNSNFKMEEAKGLKIGRPHSRLKSSIAIETPDGQIVTGFPVNFNVKYSADINQLTWNVEKLNIHNLGVTSPTITFDKPGQYAIIATGHSVNDTIISDTLNVEVLAAPAPSAAFTPTKKQIEAGERVTFVVNEPKVGNRYEWQMPGAEKEHSTSVNCATSYPAQGEYEVTLTVTTPDEQKSSQTQKISVIEVAPKADFEVAPVAILKGETTFLKDKSKYTPNVWQWLIHGGEKDVIINGQNSSFTPTTPGAYDVTLTAKNSSGSNMVTRNRAFVVCNADSKNGLNFTRPNSQVKLTRNPFAEGATEATVEWWMKPSTLSPVCCGIGEEEAMSMRVAADGSITVFFNNNTSKVGTPSEFVTPAEWHHYAVVFSKGYLKFYRDGQLFHNEKSTVHQLPTMNNFAISNEVAPLMGQIDEFRIWNSALSLTAIKQYANEPITDIAKAVADDKLAVYYDFNQSSGDVKDLSGNNNNGVRTNFGPEGDAWGLSKGVFSLNFSEDAAQQNVTAKYLKNYRASFKNTNQTVNSNNSARFRAITDWTLENATVDGNIKSGVHVDHQKKSYFTFTTGWDGFKDIKNHKAYQTVTLPAGAYTFTANFGEYEGNCGNSYLAVNLGKGLPDTPYIGEAYASSKMLNKNNSHMSNSVSFVLPEETTVSLGLLINLDGKNCCAIKDFSLTYSDVEIREADGANGYNLSIDATGYSTLCLSYPTILPEGVKAFTVKGVKNQTLDLEEITDGVLPANTGAIVIANTGAYHFYPSATPGKATSILLGIVSETERDANQLYYSLDAQDKPGFYLYNGEVLEMNRAYLVREAGDTNEHYLIDLTQTGIENMEDTTAPVEMFDISGRRVNQPNKGVYISNGKKVYVK